MNTPYTLNIGLHSGAAAEITQITQAAVAEGLLVCEFETQDSTLVMTVVTAHSTSIFARVFHLCQVLHRQAIAVFDPIQNDGYLVGDRSVAYGAFDLAYFKRLSAAPV